MLEWLMLADDRTGALEVAGAVAAGLDVPVGVVSCAADLAAVAERTATAPVAVIDVGTRHLPVPEAAARLAAVPTDGARRRAYKLDSTLRGNWATDVVALAGPRAERVLVVAAFPAMGRTCRDGVVHLDGRPLVVDDARAEVRSPVAAAHLQAAGVDPADIAALGDAAAVRQWVTDGAGARRYGVCDAETDADLVAIGRALDGSVNDSTGIVVVGTSASIAACVVGSPLSTGSAAAIWAARPVDPPDRSHPTQRVLVVCGSLHPMAASQIALLRAAARAGERAEVVVIVGEPPAVLPVEPAAAERAAAALAEQAWRHLRERAVDTMVIVGGDTAAAVLGSSPRLVRGVAAVGMPWSVALDGSGPVVVTKAGGFGAPDSLVEMILARTGCTR